jgi:hypothetical protein
MYGYVQGCHLMSLVATVMAEGVLRSTAAKCQKSIRTPGKRNLEFKKSSCQSVCKGIIFMGGQLGESSEAPY